LIGLEGQIEDHQAEVTASGIREFLLVESRSSTRSRGAAGKPKKLGDASGAKGRKGRPDGYWHVAARKNRASQIALALRRANAKIGRGRWTVRDQGIAGLKWGGGSKCYMKPTKKKKKKEHLNKRRSAREGVHQAEVGEARRREFRSSTGISRSLATSQRVSKTEKEVVAWRRREARRS